MAKKAAKRAKKMSTKRRAVKDMSASKAGGVKGGMTGASSARAIKF
jgi:hypothetical protein